MLRFPLAILVVFVHSFGADIDVSELHARGLTGLAVYDYIRLFFSVVIARSAVPIFFVISGYLLFWKVEEYSKQVYVGKLKKRWHSLVIPYLSWNMLIVLWTLAFKLGGILLHGKPWCGISDYFLQNGCLHMLWDSSVWDERTTWLGVETHNSGPVLLPFWYMLWCLFRHHEARLHRCALEVEICDSTVGSDSDGDADLYWLGDGQQCFEDDSSLVGYLPKCGSHHRGFSDVQASRLVPMEQEVG